MEYPFFDQMSDIRSQKTEIRRQMTEDRGQRTDVRSQISEFETMCFAIFRLPYSSILCFLISDLCILSSTFCLLFLFYRSLPVIGSQYGTNWLSLTIQTMWASLRSPCSSNLMSPVTPGQVFPRMVFCKVSALVVPALSIAANAIMPASYAK